MAQGKGSTTALMALGAATLAGAGAYFLYGSKHAKKNRERVKSWTLMAKAEVLEKIEKAKKLDMKEYQSVIDDVMIRYKGVEGVTARELKALGGELKGYWSNLVRAASGGKRAQQKKKGK